jgi:micrococcal nuclease
MGWTDRIFPNHSNNSNSNEKEWKLSDYVTVSPEVREKWKELEQLTPTQTAVLIAAASVAFAAGFKAGRMQPVWKRFTTVQDIPSSYFGSSSSVFLRGRCLTVSDGDTIRFRHAPALWSRSQLRESEKLSDEALAIRICTIDTPETAKFGKPGQPFGDKAKEHLSSMLENKIVYCRLLQKDQYGRAVAEVRTGFWPFYRYADERMLKAGLAEVYLGSGAVYGHRGKDYYLAMEEKARSSKKGIWSENNRESAADYKARLKAASP